MIRLNLSKIIAVFLLNKFNIRNKYIENNEKRQSSFRSTWFIVGAHRRLHFRHTTCNFKSFFPPFPSPSHAYIFLQKRIIFQAYYRAFWCVSRYSQLRKNIFRKAKNPFNSLQCISKLSILFVSGINKSLESCTFSLHITYFVFICWISAMDLSMPAL